MEIDGVLQDRFFLAPFVDEKTIRKKKAKKETEKIFDYELILKDDMSTENRNIVEIFFPL
jgi:hypothetical protein